MFNPVQQIHIGKASGAVNTVAVTNVVTNIASVVVGDVFLVNSAMKVIAAASDITPKVHIATGVAAGKIKLSPAIPVGNIISIATQAYQAQAQKVIKIGNIGSGTLDINPLSGNTYKLTILIRDDQRFMPQRQTKRDIVIKASFAASVPTAAEKTAFVASIVSAINADEFLKTLVVAASIVTGAYDGLSITGLAQTYNKYNNRPEYVDFTASLYDVTDATSTYQATTTVSQAFQPGTGLGSQIDAMERKLAANDGFTNKIQHPVIEPPLFASTALNYDTIAINYMDETPGALEGRDKKPKGIVLAHVTGSAQAAAMIVSLELLNNSGAGEISNNSTILDSDI